MLKRLAVIMLLVLNVTGCSIYKNDNDKGAEVMTNGVQNTVNSTNESLMDVNYKKYIDDKNNFSISYPESWSIATDFNGVIINIDNNKDNQILVQRYEEGVTLGSGIDGIPEQVTTSFITNSGIKSEKTEFVYDGKKEIHIYFESKYGISVIATLETYNKRIKEIEKVIKSFDYK